jgi:molecular chaperone DnaK
MVKEAEKHAEEDRRRREEAEKLNEADGVSYQAERFLADFGDKIAAGQRGPIEQHVRDIKAAIGKKDVGQASALAEALRKLLQEAGKAIYAQAAAAKPEPPKGTQAGEEPTVVDADYREAAR